MSVFYPCPKCGADVDDDNKWVQEFPLEYCPENVPFHEKCGYETHLDFCLNPNSCKSKRELK